MSRKSVTDVYDRPLPPLTEDQLLARARVEVEAEARALKSDTTVPGGAYLVGGQWVDANGDPLPDMTAEKFETMVAEQRAATPERPV